MPRQTRGWRAAKAVSEFAREWATSILFLLFGTTTLVQAYVVPTASMETTVMTGDHLFVDKLAYAPSAPDWAKHLLPYAEVQRGNVIVFRYPRNLKETYVKRAIGVPGDRIHIRDKQVYVNGQALAEPYKRLLDTAQQAYLDNFPEGPHGFIYERGQEMVRDHVHDGELVVPPGMYFALGDNRDNSEDSRFWGLVPKANIIGRPVIVFWSYDAPTEHWVDPNYTFDHAQDLALHFFSKTRWDRTLHLIH